MFKSDGNLSIYTIDIWCMSHLDRFQTIDSSSYIFMNEDDKDPNLGQPFYINANYLNDVECRDRDCWCSNKFGRDNIRGTLEKYINGGSAFILRFKNSEDLIWYTLLRDSIK